MRQHGFQLFVDTFGIEPVNQLRHWHFKYLADAEQGGHRDWPTGLHLLPVAGGEAEGEHVLLRVAVFLPKLLYSDAEGAKELVLIRHPSTCKGIRAKVPRAD